MIVGSGRVLRSRRRSFVSSLASRSCSRVTKAPKSKPTSSTHSQSSKSRSKPKSFKSMKAMDRNRSGRVAKVGRKPGKKLTTAKPSPVPAAKPTAKSNLKSHSEPLPEVSPQPKPVANEAVVKEEVIEAVTESSDKMQLLFDEFLESEAEDPVKLENNIIENTSRTITAEELTAPKPQCWPLDEPAQSLTFSILNSPNKTMENPKKVTMDTCRSTNNCAETTEFDDFFDYDSMCEESSGDESHSSESSSSKVPLCGFRDRNTRLESSLAAPKLTSRRLFAAWKTLYPDVLPGSREAYTQAVVLAASSMNQTSLMSGRARETMVSGRILVN